MSYTRVELEEIIRESVINLKKNDTFLLNKNNNINEVSISSKLSHLLSEKIKGYSVDAEYNKMLDTYGKYSTKRLGALNNQKVFPDIIVHQRGTNDNNLLVIEIKMAWKNAKKDFDLQKISAFIDELDYKNGLYLELGEDGIVEEIWFPEEE